jgi:trans-L-3-hydroxyproline dehydratase
MISWTEQVSQWSPRPEWRRILTVDAHTEGEPLRVIFGGFADLEGQTVLDLRRYAREHHDDLRRALMWEPRGHADMYGCLVVPPVTDEADIGVLFMHNEGFSTMCGHGIIGVTTVLLECGLIEAHEPQTRIGIDTPAGFVEATALVEHGRVSSVSFVNVPSFVAELDGRVKVPDVGTVRYDVAFGGAFYAYVDAADFGLKLVREEYRRIIEVGRAIKTAVETHSPPSHPDGPELGFLYGTIFVGPPHAAGAHSRNVCVFADGEVDRCPTGTGVSGRLAIHRARGQVRMDEEIVVESLIGTRFGARIVRMTQVGSHDAVVPEVTGRAFVTGRNEIFLDPEDPLWEGFLLR